MEYYIKDLSKSSTYPNKQHKNIQNIRMTEFTYSQIVNFPSKSLVLSLSILELDIYPYNYFLWRIKAHKPVQSNVLYLRSHKHWILISESERNKLRRDSAPPKSPVCYNVLCVERAFYQLAVFCVTLEGLLVFLEQLYTIEKIKQLKMY